MSRRAHIGCIRPGCDRPHFARCLCHVCYKAALRLVQARRTTWEYLEIHGKAKCLRHKTDALAAAEWLLDVPSATQSKKTRNPDGEHP